MKTTDPTEFFTQYLKRNKYRITPERFEILETVLHCEGHFDADELFLKMKNTGSKVSRATVYNTLEKLTDCGIVGRYRFGERLARYEIMFGTEHHHHIICSNCGKIEEFVDKRVERFAREAAVSLHYGFETTVLHIYGICLDCQKKDGA